MSLENLLDRKLARLDAEPEAALKLLSAATRNLADSEAVNISAENRFDAAYKSIMQSATIGLRIKGYRTLTSEPGHHQTTLQILHLTLGLEQDTIVVLDKLRKQRNLADYSGDPVSDAALAECRRQAKVLVGLARERIREKWPDLKISG